MSVSNPRQTFVNPVVPFAGTVLGGLLPGEMVLIQGSVPPGADRFQVDLTCGSSVKPRADVAFHFNPRFNRKCIVCNSLQKERWGREEILHHMPFALGASFELIVLVRKDTFKVAVNGVHVLEYRQRLELQRVDTLAVSGKVTLAAVGVLPSSSPASLAVAPANQDAESNPIVSSSGDLAVPFRGELAKGLSAGRSITIRARTNHNAQSFSVNLRALGDIALHLNPRLRKATFVRNSFLSECWGPEETQLDHFPFSAGQYFEMIILCEPQYFSVAVNGIHQLSYKHRVQPLSRLTQLEVTGDVTLLHVQLL